MNKKTVVVLGAGWAGLSCAVNLAQAGWQVTVLEQSKRLGGRASSFTLPDGQQADNGQHLLMGCYHSALQFLRTIGSDNLVQVQQDLRIPFVDRQGRKTFLSCPRLPAPLHLLFGLIGLNTLSWRDKFSMVQIERAVKKSRQVQEQSRLKKITVLDWLKECGQSDNAIVNLWEPVCLATINLEPARAEAESFVTVLRLAFFASAKDSRMVVPLAGLSVLCAKAQDFLQARGGKIVFNQLVKYIHTQNDQVTGIELRDGQIVQADLYVSALSFYTFRNVMDKSWLEHSFFSGVQKMQSSPIYSLALWLDRAVIQEKFYGLLDTRVQWVFNKNIIFKNVGTSGQYLSLVLSDAAQYASLSDAQILEFALQELQDCFSEMRNAKVQKYLLQREKNATLLHVPGYQELRPNQKTPLQNFYLCGDWTNTQLPATIESAARSGQMAAAQIYENFKNY